MLILPFSLILQDHRLEEETYALITDVIYKLMLNTFPLVVF